MLLVRAYNDLFVFHANSVVVRLLSGKTAIAVNSLPSENSSGLLEAISAKLGSANMSANPCSDCLIPITSAFSSDTTFGNQPISTVVPSAASLSTAQKYAFKQCPSTGCIAVPEPVSTPAPATTTPPSYTPQPCVTTQYKFNTETGFCAPVTDPKRKMPLAYWGSATSYTWGALNLRTYLNFNDYAPQGTKENFLAYFGYWWGNYWIYTGTFYHFGGYRQDVYWAPTVDPLTWDSMMPLICSAKILSMHSDRVRRLLCSGDVPESVDQIIANAKETGSLKSAAGLRS